MKKLFITAGHSLKVGGGASANGLIEEHFVSSMRAIVIKML